MGGQHHYFGLWVDVDFGKGHSKAKPTCTTYNSPQLSGQEDFRFEQMEVWGVGDSPSVHLVSRDPTVQPTRPLTQVPPALVCLKWGPQDEVCAASGSGPSGL